MEKVCATISQVVREVEPGLTYSHFCQESFLDAPYENETTLWDFTN